MNHIQERLGKCVACLVAMVAGLLVFGHTRANREIAGEWQAQMGRRTPEQIRGLLDNMIEYRRGTVPAFAPNNLWHREMCALAVINAVNFLLGEERLKIAPAWKFAEANKDAVELVYDRSVDFYVEDGQIKESHNRRIRLVDIVSTIGTKGQLTSSRIYVVGYHYHETRSDPLILQAGGTLNSHLMLLIGRKDGSWWGYHMLHHAEAPLGLPFRIDELSNEMPKWFDMMYIWEVKGIELPSANSGSNLVLVHHLPEYKQAVRHLGLFGRNKAGYYLDAALTFYFADHHHYPQVVDLSENLVDTGMDAKWLKIRRGDFLGFYKKVPIFRNAGSSRRGKYGLEFECVEFVNRFLVSLGHRNLTQTGNADSYYYDAARKGLRSFANGSGEPPQADDLIVFDKDRLGRHPGHVGVVSGTLPGKVCLVQQNASLWYRCLPLVQKEGNWHVSALNNDLPCVGWSRRF